MLRRIKLHNYLNGHIFSGLEYLVVVAVLAPFLAYYLTHGRALYSVLAIGVILNCLTISAVALKSILNKEDSIGIMRFMRDKNVRTQVGSDHPRLSNDTMVLSLTVLVPFWIFGAALIDLVRGRG